MLFFCFAFITSVEASSHSFAIKGGLDFSGSLKMELNDEILLEDTEVGYTPSVEYIYSLKNMDIGAGGEYLYARKTVKKSSEKFEFANIYSTAGLNLGRLFLRGRLGYNFFIPPKSQANDPGLSTNGGLSYGGSTGLMIGPVELEVLYGVNNANIVEENFNEKTNLTYTRYGLSLGFVF